jgi:hypothetical protein
VDWVLRVSDPSSSMMAGLRILDEEALGGEVVVAVVYHVTRVRRMVRLLNDDDRTHVQVHVEGLRELEEVSAEQEGY